MIKKIIWSVVAATLVSLAGTAWWVNASVNRSAGDDTPNVKFTVAKGEGVKLVADNLHDRRLIDNPLAWTIYVMASGLRSSLLPGEYELNSSMTGRQIARTITNDLTARKEVTVKILEGWTAVEIASQLEKQGVLPADDFQAIAKVPDSRTIVQDTYYEFLTDKPSTAGMDGFLFPDTYRFFQQATPTSVLRKFLDNFNQKLKPETRSKIKTSGRTYYQTVIMASILEKELKTDVDRAMAADIFWRRLDIGMALQSDATVNYVTGKGRLRPSLEDIQVNSLYNTYKYPGLPPGPIGNPGLSAIRAAANPQANEYWYYLSGQDGKTHYAKTLEEHNRNKQLYL